MSTQLKSALYIYDLLFVFNIVNTDRMRHNNQLKLRQKDISFEIGMTVQGCQFEAGDYRKGVFFLQTGL